MLFLKKRIELEPNSYYEAELRDEGPPTFGEIAWEEEGNGHDILRCIEKYLTNPNIDIMVCLRPNTLEKYTLVRFDFGCG